MEFLRVASPRRLSPPSPFTLFLLGSRDPLKGPRGSLTGARGPLKGSPGPFKGPRDPLPSDLQRAKLKARQRAVRDRTCGEGGGEFRIRFYTHARPTALLAANNSSGAVLTQ